MELIELKEFSTAFTFLSKSEPLLVLRELDPDRYLYLQSFCVQKSSDSSVYSGISKEKRRSMVAEDILKSFENIESSRLIKLLGQSIKWQHLQGLIPNDTTFDLFKGTSLVMKSDLDTPPCTLLHTLPFPKNQRPICATFSFDGQYLVTGTKDGFIEVWNYMTGKLRTDLKYQAEEMPMLMETAVLCLDFSKDSTFLASGSQDGKVRIWKPSTGQSVKRFPSAHSQGITSIHFNKDSSQILTSSFDCLVRIHGIKSGKMLKEFRGHTSFVNEVIYTNEDSKIVSVSSDGTLKVFTFYKNTR